MKRSLLVALLSTLLLVACSTEHSQNQPFDKQNILPGSFRFALQLEQYELPFTATLDLNTENGQPSLTIHNAGENITVDRLRITKDSLIADLPVFQSALLCRIESPDLLSGSYVDYSREVISPIPFMAERGKDFRFTNTRSTKALPDRYKVVFDRNGEKAFPAVLLLNNTEGSLDATFLTETGDFRFLEGNIMNERIYLSAFDGSHVFYFEAEISGDSLVNGIFRSGPNYEASWEAAADSLYELTPPDELTYMVEGYKYVELPFPNQDGDTLDWKGLGLENKVVVIDIFGSWCPNCMDASIALHELTKKYSDNDIALVPVAFELTQDLGIARERIFKMQNDLGLPTHFLFGGTASKRNAATKFPMLNNISSFPTIIIIDKKRNVRSVYTGFYGPGTGSHYDKFMKETDAILASLVAGN